MQKNTVWLFRLVAIVFFVSGCQALIMPKVPAFSQPISSSISVILYESPM